MIHIILSLVKAVLTSHVSTEFESCDHWSGFMNFYVSILIVAHLTH